MCDGCLGWWVGWLRRGGGAEVCASGVEHWVQGQYLLLLNHRRTQHCLSRPVRPAGALLGELTDPNLSTISPVNKPHPRLEVIGVANC